MANNIFKDGVADITIDLTATNWRKQVYMGAKFADAWNRGLEKGVRKFGEALLKKLHEELAIQGVGLLSTTVTMTVDEDSVLIEFVDPEVSGAIFLEYGVGITGSTKPHPSLPSGWVYGSGETILPDGNWWYPDDDPYPQQATFIGRNGQQYALTVNRGQVGRRFVYNTWKWGTKMVTKIVVGEINKEIRKVYGR